jgi:hypothetical protein
MSSQPLQLPHRSELHRYAVLEPQLLAACRTVGGCVWLGHEVLGLWCLAGHPERLQVAWHAGTAIRSSQKEQPMPGMLDESSFMLLLLLLPGTMPAVCPPAPAAAHPYRCATAAGHNVAAP